MSSDNLEQFEINSKTLEKSYPGFLRYTWTSRIQEFKIRQTCLIRLLSIIGYLYMSGMCLGVEPRMSIKKCVFKKYWTTCPKSIDYSKHNRQHNWGEGPIWPFKKHNNLRFNIKYDIHVNSTMYKKSGYNFYLNLQPILC